MDRLELSIGTSLSDETFRRFATDPGRVFVPGNVDPVELAAIVLRPQHQLLILCLSVERLEELFRLGESTQESLWTIQTRKGFDRLTAGIEHVVNAVSGDCALELAAVAEVNGDDRRGTH